MRVAPYETDPRGTTGRRMRVAPYDGDPNS